MLADNIIRFYPLLISMTAFTLMFIVGTDCTWTGVRDCLRRPGLAATVVLGQFIIVPAVMLASCRLAAIPAAITASLMLIACCPTGSISNAYSYLAKANTSLSVGLTALSCLVAVAATPLALYTVYQLLDARGDSLPFIPPVALARQLVMMMLVPLLLGGMLAAWKPEWILRRQYALRRTSVVILLILLVLIIGTGPAEIIQHLREITLVTILFTLTLLLLGWLTGRTFHLISRDRLAVMFEFPCRNLAIAAVVGFSVLDRPDLVRFAAALFIIEAAIILLLLGVMNGVLTTRQASVK